MQTRHKRKQLFWHDDSRYWNALQAIPISAIESITPSYHVDIDGCGIIVHQGVDLDEGAPSDPSFTYPNLNIAIGRVLTLPSWMKVESCG
jgi:hypothetical protein